VSAPNGAPGQGRGAGTPPDAGSPRAARRPCPPRQPPGDGAPAGACPSCGSHHRRPDIEIRLERGALSRLGELAGESGWRRLVVVADANTAEVLGEQLAGDLAAAGHLVERAVFPQHDGLLADEAAVTAVRAAIASPGGRADAAVAVGSGTLNDITRYASSLEQVPYCSVPTAASMDGYASSVAAMQFGGVKVSFAATAPRGIFAEPAIVAAAPAAMTRWGLGDLLGKASASYDWRLGHAVTGEPFCAAIEARVLDPLRRCSEQVDAILAGEQSGVQLLLTGLVESGVAMAMAGNSRPASGSEHHCSHFWDLLAYRGRREHGPHGLQVAFATGFTTQLQRLALEHLGRPLRITPGCRDGAAAHWMGDPSPEIVAVRDAKAAEFARYGSSWPPAPAALAHSEEQLRASVSLFDPARAALRRAGVPERAGYLGVDAEALRATLRYANRLRNRFTVLDLLEAQGVLGEAIEGVLCRG
jgi:glycerol-1-phosphate dehydrogenase [NAD(P)+]